MLRYHPIICHARLPEGHGQYQRVQILTIKEILDGKRIDYPQSIYLDKTFKKAPIAPHKDIENLSAKDVEIELDNDQE